MKIRDRLLAATGKALSASPDGLLTLASGRGGLDASSALAFQGSSYFGFPRSEFLDGYYYSVQNASYGAMYETQPAVRAVIDHLAGHFAQVPVKLYKGYGSKKVEDDTHEVVDLLRYPNDWHMGATLMRDLAVDFLVYENAYLVKVRNPGGSQPFILQHIPAYAMGVRGANRLHPDGYRIVYADGSFLQLDPSEVIHWRGTNAVDPRVGWSRMETLRQTLISETMRQQADIAFSRSGRVRGGIIQRPIEAPAWSDDASRRFEEGFSARMRGLNQGRSPVLEDGMTWVNAAATPSEAEAIEAAQLALATVCHVFGLHPSVMGVYSSEGNLAEGRDAEYQDVLPPLFAGLADALTLGLMVTEYEDRVRHFGFDMTAKLEGDIETLMRTTIMSTGAAFITRNEARALFGLPPVKGGEELITPLNVVTGAVPAPNVMPPQHATSGPGQAPKPADNGVPTTTEPGTKADDPKGKALVLARRQAATERRDQYGKTMADVYRRHYNRQAVAVASKAAQALNSDRWNTELAADIRKARTAIVQNEADIVSARLGGTFDMAYVKNYIEAGAKAQAQHINDATQAAVDKKKNELVTVKATADVAAEVLATAAADQANNQGQQDGYATANFATLEAAKQNPGEHGMRLKTWVWSHLPNSRHGALSDEHEPIGVPFSNGMRYPGDPLAGPEQTTNCKCQLDVI